MTQVTFAGWLAGRPAIAGRDSAEAGAWSVQALTDGAWQFVGRLPDGSTPIADGNVYANVLAPGSESDLAILTPDGVAKPITLPSESWVDEWRGLRLMVPLGSASGFLLGGGATFATVNDDGLVGTSSLPTGYVALAPTSDARRVLLATVDDAQNPGGLSESAPFTAYIWTVDSRLKPLPLHDHVVEVRASSVGLAWLRTDDGSWWSLSSDAQLERRTLPSKERTTLSPDGLSAVRFPYSVSGCSQSSADPCSVELVDSEGSTRSFPGPSLGVGFSGDNVAILLAARMSLRLPWRLVVGPPSDTTTIEIR